jgi:hypothetical protein
LEKDMSNGTKVVKRNGTKEPLDLNKLHVMVEEACKDLAGVSASQVEMQSGIQFYDGITTAEIQEILIRSASDLIDLDHPNYQFVAARLLLFATRKQLYGRMHEVPTVKQHVDECIKKGVYDSEIADLYTDEEFEKLQSMIDHDRDYLFTYAGLRQVVDKYLVQDRSSGTLYETPQFMYLLIAASIPKKQDSNMSNDTTTQSASTKSTFPHLSWRECELHFDNLLAVFLLMLMTPSIASLVLIWLSADMLHKGRESASTQVESVVSTVRSEVEKCSIQVLSLSSKSLNLLSDVALKMAYEVDQQLSTFQSGTKK